MLTKDDLQAIRGIVKEEVCGAVSTQLDTKLKPIHQKLNKLDKKVDLIARVLDADIVNLDKRVAKLESIRFGGSSVGPHFICGMSAQKYVFSGITQFPLFLHRKISTMA